jgi:hypothetical protein
MAASITRTKKWGIIAVASACVVAVAAVMLWSSRDSTPYALRDKPGVDVEVQAGPSDYKEVGEVTREVEPLIKVYVQRLLAGDPKDLAEIGAPWFTGRQQAARMWITDYQDLAGERVEAVVRDPVVPDQAAVEIHFSGGREQVVGLTRADGVWWMDMGEGDPAKP